jgi:Helicase conserved C-terminal domain
VTLDGLPLKEYLDDKRVSELHEFFTFWGGDEALPEGRDGLIVSLTELMSDETTVYRKVKVLSEKPLQVLLLLVRQDGFHADAASLLRNDSGIRIEHYEIEAAAKALARRGFLAIVRDRSWLNYGREAYVIPTEIGDLVGTLLAEERRGIHEVLTLAGHLAEEPEARRVKRITAAGGRTDITDFEKLANHLARDIGMEGLYESLPASFRKLLLEVLDDYGGVISRSAYEKAFRGRAQWHRKRWQKRLEENLLGTMTTLSLRDYGINMEGETTVIFVEVAEAALLAKRIDTGEFDRVAMTRIDLVTDLQYLLNYVARQPVRVTQQRTIYKAAHQKILDGLVSREDGDLIDRVEVLNLCYTLSLQLGLLRVDQEKFLALTSAGQAWESRSLVEKIQVLCEKFMEERGSGGKDFHLEKMRQLLLDLLEETGAPGWRPMLALCFAVRNRYLARLDSEGIRERFRNRFQYTYTPPRDTTRALAETLRRWVVKRLYMLGLVDLGLAEGEAVALRITDLGRKVLDLPGEVQAVEEGRPLVVNPDFEVLLLPEGDITETAHTLDHFAIRTGSEEVNRYLIHREGVERAVAKGMSADEILEFLAQHSRTPIPQNVEYSIRDWGKKVRFARQEEVVLLEVDDSEALDIALALEPVRRLLLRRIGPNCAALRGRIGAFKTIEELRRLGIFLR